MAVYNVTGKLEFKDDAGNLIDITGEITIEDLMRGYQGQVGFWEYKALIQSFDLSYGGLRFTGTNGSLQSSPGADDTWLILESESGMVLNFHDSGLPGLPTSEELTIPTPSEWSVSPTRNESGFLVQPLNKSIYNGTTRITSTLSPVPRAPQPQHPHLQV